MKDQKKRKKRGKRDIIQDVRAKGVSARKAAKAVDLVFKIWKRELGMWDSVETPCGTLEVRVVKGDEQATLQCLQNISTKEPMVRMIHYPGRRRVVKLKPDPTLKLPLDPLPPPPAPPPHPPETADESEERQLVTYLLELGKPADDATMATVRQAVGAHPRKPGERLSYAPGALLRRLRQFKARGWHFHFASELAQQVSEYHWL